MTRQTVASKQVDNRYLLIRQHESETHYPGHTVYSMCLANNPTPAEGECTTEFLLPPHAYALSLAVYCRVFDAINSHEDFERLRGTKNGLEKMLRQVQEALP